MRKTKRAMTLGVKWMRSNITHITEHSRYISTIDCSSTKYTCIKSAKGTGKTYQLEKLVAKFKKQKRSILVITHRISLAESLSVPLANRCKEKGLYS